MKILFMGTPDFARAILEAVHKSGEEIVGVVTQPDKPVGRKHVLTPPPVKVYATENNIPVYQPATLKDGAFAAELDALAPELIMVAAYGKILPAYVLDYPKYGCINAHGSLLPKYRGAAPIQRAILDGETVTGVTSMYMEAGLDTGDMILKVPVEITEEDDFGTLHDKLAAAGCEAMLQTVAQLKAGTVHAEKQDGSLSCYAAKIENTDCALDFSRPVKEVHNRVRALSPAPLSVALTADGKTLKVISAAAEVCAVTAAAGTVVATDKGTVDVACADGILHITGVQPEGKGRMRAQDFINGRKIAVGDVLGTPKF